MSIQEMIGGRVERLREAARRLDWRVWAVILAMFISVVATAAVYVLGIWQNPSDHIGAVFASWVSGVALFLVVGLVVAIVSITRPEQESFDARARILFRRQTGKHIDYIVSRMKELLEHYAESTEIKVVVEGFDANERKFRLSVLNTVVVRSYLDDVVSTYNSEIYLQETTSPPLGGAPNRLVFLRVDGVPDGKSEEFLDSIHRPISTTIDRHNSCEIQYLTEFWTRADEEPNSHTPKRYTQCLKLIMENLADMNGSLRIEVSKDQGQSWENVSLGYGETRLVLECTDIPPRVDAYIFRLLAP